MFGYAPGVLLLGLDIGTSATKALLCDLEGRIVASASSPHALSQPRAGWSEQHPEWWWSAAKLATAQALAQVLAPTSRSGAAHPPVGGIALSGQMHGSVLLASDGPASGGQAMALRPALLWNDQRTARECDEIEAAAGGRAALIQLTGNRALTGFTLPKLLWLRRHEPELWARVRHVILPKDFVRFRLTGAIATDAGDGTGMLLQDVSARAWSRTLAEAVGVDSALLPATFDAGQIVGHVTPWAAAQIGLPANIPVAAGSGDNQCGAVGAGVVEPGLVLASLGTSGVIYAHTDQPRKDPLGRLQTMCGPTPRGWCLTGCMLSAAGSLRWARDTIAPGVSYDTLMAEAERVPPGCDGLVFLPYLTGERCPHADPLARAGWIGLTARHTRGHLFRAVVEGVTFGMTQMLNLARAAGAEARSIRLTGGGNQAPLWRQMQADLYGAPVETTSAEEGGCALGAALLAGVAVGVWPSAADACRAVVRAAARHEPGADAPAYARSRAVYEELYGRLKTSFAELAPG